MPFFPNSSLYSKNYPRNINHIPVVIFSYASILEKIAILGQPPRSYGSSPNELGERGPRQHHGIFDKDSRVQGSP